ncbi:MAG TPA: hypothetical protein VGX70_06515, partial [Gemmataceae bacterium]|nr:hypothetical protein [Gemmataceae bacterium]
MSAGLAFDAFVAFVNSNPPGSLNGAAKQRQSVGPGAASATSSAMPAGAVMAAAPPSLAAGPAPSQAPEIPSVTIDPETVSLVGGDQRQFNVAAEYADGSEDITSQVEWLSEPKGLISFDSYGLATTMPVSQTTTVTVIAKDPRTSKQAVSIVTLRAIPPDEPPKLQSITIEPSNPTIVAGKPLPFKAMGLFVSGDKKKSTHELTEGITWKSLLPDILSIDEHSGLASVVMPTRQNPPTVQIAVTETKTGKTGTTHVIVKVETVAETVLETITIEPQNLEINNGTRLQLKAWGVYSPGNWRQEETEAVDWSSSNDAAVWVDSKGTATALDVMPEVVTITATDPNSKKFGQTRLTVVNRHLKSISISPENAPVPQVGHTQFKAIGHYDKPYEPAVLDKIVWSSREPAIVFIDQEGKAVGQKPGTTLIKAYSPYWNSTGSTVVTVPDFKSINVFSDQPPAV